MRTDDLIDQLAGALRPMAPGAVPRRFAALAVAGGLTALVLVLVWLGVRPDLNRAVGGAMFWTKAGYTAALAIAGFWACERLARPDGRPRAALILGGAVLALFVGAGLVQALSAPGDARLALMLGGSWAHCSLYILALGVPTLAAALILMRRMAPTRPALAGFAAGAFSGGVAATVYGLHCGESAMAFVGVWYTLGVLACAGLGAVVGRWALRW